MNDLDFCPVEKIPRRRKFKVRVGEYSHWKRRKAIEIRRARQFKEELREKYSFQ